MSIAIPEYGWDSFADKLRYSFCTSNWLLGFFFNYITSWLCVIISEDLCCFTSINLYRSCLWILFYLVKLTHRESNSELSQIEEGWYHWAKLISNSLHLLILYMEKYRWYWISSIFFFKLIKFLFHLPVQFSLHFCWSIALFRIVILMWNNTYLKGFYISVLYISKN